MYLSNGRRPSYVPTRKKTTKWPFIIVTLIVVGIVGAGFVLFAKQNSHKNNTSKSTNSGNNTGSNTSAPTFDKTRYSLSDPTSIWIVANKQRQLQPKDYAPNDLRAPSIPLRNAATSPEMQVRDEAATALERMTTAAKAEGANLMLASGYRSYNQQIAVYNSEVKAYGQAKADTESARPGYSEHQTGLAMDLEPSSRACEIADCFAATTEGKWLAANAYKYGFLLRYPSDKVAITGYRYEPWHFRYIGIDLSTELHNQNTSTLEEFFSLPAAPNY